jgi:aldehyde:ferredoxin oxidoreductase
MLKIDLSNGQITREQIPADWVHEFIGGSGLAARLLWHHLDASLDPLDPASPLLFITGPLTGAGGPTPARFSLCARSPQTGLWGESNMGGFVGPELRNAGVDVLWITGQAADPVYLWIHNAQVELRPAGHLWGQADTYETQRIIRAETGEAQARVACIGLAGENGLPCAGVLADHGRLAARTGMGAVMGAKRLKAVAVRGNGKVPLADEATFKRLRLQANKNLLEQNMTAIFKATGTSGALDYLQMVGDMPQKYWTAGSFEGASQISGGEMASTILTGTTACQGCVIACGREVHIPEGPYATPPKSKGPEYETIAVFGSQLLVSDLAQVTALGERCDRLGLDTISAGGTIGLAYLLFERGLLNAADTGGLELRWGDGAPAFDLLDQMARRQGFGELLAQGSRALAAHFGDPDLAVQVNGLDVAMHDPRAFSGQALAYLTSPRGACHNQSDFFNVEMGGTLDDIGIGLPERWQDAGKAALVARHQYWRTACNSLTVCFFAVVPPAELAELLSAALGEPWTPEELITAGQRAWNLKRAINCRLGLTPAAEKLPKLLLQALPEGGQEGYIPHVETLLDEYYAVSGWERASGRPLPDTLRQLGLDFTLSV